MSDREEIVDVLLRYATDIDRRDWALFRTVRHFNQVRAAQIGASA
jgi:hypothetical protein